MNRKEELYIRFWIGEFLPSSAEQTSGNEIKDLHFEVLRRRKIGHVSLRLSFCQWEHWEPADTNFIRVQFVYCGFYLTL